MCSAPPPPRHGTMFGDVEFAESHHATTALQDWKAAWRSRVKYINTWIATFCNSLVFAETAIHRRGLVLNTRRSCFSFSILIQRRSPCVASYELAIEDSSLFSRSAGSIWGSKPGSAYLNRTRSHLDRQFDRNGSQLRREGAFGYSRW